MGRQIPAKDGPLDGGGLTGTHTRTSCFRATAPPASKAGRADTRDRQKDRHANNQVGRRTQQAGTQADWLRSRQTGRRRETGKQAESQTQTGRQKLWDTEKWTQYIHPCPKPTIYRFFSINVRGSPVQFVILMAFFPLQAGVQEGFLQRRSAAGHHSCVDQATL